MEVGNNALNVGMDDDIPHGFDPDLVATVDTNKAAAPSTPTIVKVTDNPSETNISVDSVDMAALATSGVTLERIAHDIKTLSDIEYIKTDVGASRLVAQSDVFDLKTALEDYPTSSVQGLNPKVFTVAPSTVNSNYFIRTVEDVDAQIRNDVIAAFREYANDTLRDTVKVCYRLRDVYLKRITDIASSTRNELITFIANYENEKDCKYFSGPQGLVDISSLDIRGDWLFAELHSSCTEFDESILPECDAFKRNIAATLECPRFRGLVLTLPTATNDTAYLTQLASAVDTSDTITTSDISNLLRDSRLTEFLENAVSVLTGSLDEVVTELQEKTKASLDDPELAVNLDYELIKDYSVRLKDLVTQSSRLVNTLNTSAVFLANSYGLFSRFNQF